MRALDVSDAGYTTTIGPATHGNESTCSLRSAGSLGGAPVLIESLEDGFGVGHREIVISNDPAEPAFQPYICFSRL